MMALPQRKRNRLKFYDYSSAGCYFVTICTHNGEWLFGDSNELSNAGKIVDEQIQAIKTHYSDIKIDNYVIMPNHIHMMVTIGCEAMPDEENTICGEVLGKNTHNSLEKIVGLFKSGVTREVHKVEPKILKVWQRSYFDHIIVGKKEYDEIWDYVDANPIRWQIKYKILRDGQDRPLC